MKKLLIGLALGTATSLAVRKIARDHKLHDHCRQMMSNHCHGTHDDRTEPPTGAEAQGSCCADSAAQAAAR